jgi:hypothetical protein
MLLLIKWEIHSITILSDYQKMPLLRFRNTHWLKVHKLVIACNSFQIWSFYRFLFWQKFKHHLNHCHLLDWSYLSELVWKNAQIEDFN